MNYRIVEFDPSTALEDLLERYFDFEDRMFREVEVENFLLLREFRRESMGDKNPRREVLRWIVIEDVDGTEDLIEFRPAREIYAFPLGGR
jgi:hypothetical protein